MVLFDVFQKGLIRGYAYLPHDPEKAYAYVEHPTEGWRVYLRSCVFLHAAAMPFSNRHFLVVKKTGKQGRAWEPPKGQMEGKDMTARKPILELLKENARRETEEEAHITHLQKLTHTGLVFQSQENDYPQNHFFQYHVFQAMVSQEQLQLSFDTFAWMKEHPKAVARWKRDRKEKDAVAWFNPRTTQLMSRWSPSIIAMYLQNVRQKI